MKIEWKTCAKVGVSAFLLYLCIHYWTNVSSFALGILDAAAPLFIGCAVAYVVNILMSLYEKWYFPRSSKKVVLKTRRVVCMIFAFVTLAAIIALVIGLVLPQLIDAVQLIIAKVPDAMKQALAILESWNILPEDIINTLESIDWKSRIEQIVSVVTSGIGNVVTVVITTISTVFSGIVTALISIIFSVYLLWGKEKLAGQGDKVMRRYMAPKWYMRVKHTFGILHDSFRRYIIGQSLEAVILGMLCTIGMLILRLPYATMIGALIAFTALIPIAGAYIGAIVGAFLILTVSPIKALIFLVFILILQQLEGNLIYPKVVGTSIGLSGLWVLAAVTIGGGIAGVLGMLLGVPLAATVYRLLREDINRGPEKTPSEPEKE